MNRNVAPATKVNEDARVAKAATSSFLSADSREFIVTAFVLIRGYVGLKPHVRLSWFR